MDTIAAAVTMQASMNSISLSTAMTKQKADSDAQILKLVESVLVPTQETRGGTLDIQA